MFPFPLFILALRASAAATWNVPVQEAAVLQFQVAGRDSRTWKEVLEVLGVWRQLKWCGYPWSGVHSVPVIIIFLKAFFFFVALLEHSHPNYKFSVTSPKLLVARLDRQSKYPEMSKYKLKYPEK